MEYKFYLTICFALIGLVATASTVIREEVENEGLRYALLNGAESLTYEDYNSAMWLKRMLTERSRWDHWQLPAGVEESDADFVRGLAAYASSIYKAEVMHHWSFGAENEIDRSQKEEYANKFVQKIVKPCEQVVSQLKAAVAPIEQSELSGYSVKLDEFAKTWMNNEKVCERIIVNVKHWIDLSYQIAEKNYAL